MTSGNGAGSATAPGVSPRQQQTGGGGNSSLGGGGTVPTPTPDDFKAALELHHYNLKQGQVGVFCLHVFLG